MMKRARSTLASSLVIFAYLILTGTPPVRGGSVDVKDTPKVIHFSGSDYEIGCQKATVAAEHYFTWEGNATRLLSGPHGKALKLALEYRLTEIRERFPSQVEQWQGIADGAGISLNDVAVGMIGARALMRTAQLPLPDPGPGEDEDEACSSFAMAHSDRGPILGKTSDRSSLPAQPQTYGDDHVVIESHTDGYTTLMAGWAVLNDQGLAVGDANAHYEGTTGTGDGLAKDLVPIIARYCPDVDSAVSFVQNYEISDDGRHFCFADSSGKIAAVEIGPLGLFNVRWGDSTGFVYVTNTSPDSTMRIHCTSDSAYFANSDSRLANFERMFTDTTFQFTFESAKGIIFNHDTVGAICQHGETFDWQMHTDRSRLILPAEMEYYFAAKENDMASWHPCENSWREFVLESVTAVQRPLAALPESITLSQNWPNPFNAQTTLTYRLTTSNYIEIAVYSLLGDLVTVLYKGFQQSGEHNLVWDGTDDVGRMVASGMYYYRLQAGEAVLTRRMTLVK